MALVARSSSIIRLGGSRPGRSPDAAGQTLYRRPTVRQHVRRRRAGFFSDGITEDIITALAKFGWFFVTARNSTFSYKGRAVDVKQIGAELGVRYVLEGSVRKAGNRVRVTGQLIDALTGNHLWAERYDREIADVFALQDEITETVIATIAPQLLVAENERVKRKPPDSMEAWELVMRF